MNSEEKIIELEEKIRKLELFQKEGIKDIIPLVDIESQLRKEDKDKIFGFSLKINIVQFLIDRGFHSFEYVVKEQKENYSVVDDYGETCFQTRVYDSYSLRCKNSDNEIVNVPKYEVEKILKREIMSKYDMI